MREIAISKQRHSESEEIQRKTEEFLKRGGKIQVLPGFQQSDGARFDWWAYSEKGPEFVKTELGGL